jgi:hypothetical protein
MEWAPQRISYSLFLYRYFQRNSVFRVLSKQLATLVLIITFVFGFTVQTTWASNNSLEELENAVKKAEEEYLEAQRKVKDAERNAKNYIKKEFSGKDAAIILAQWGPLMAQIIASGINPVVVLGAIQNLILGEVLDQMRITPDKAAVLGKKKAVVEAYKNKLEQLDKDIKRYNKDIEQNKACMKERKEVVPRVNKKLYEDNVYKKARQELEKAEKAAQLAINARLATQAAQNQANQAYNQCANLSREIKQQLEIASSIGKECNDAKKALSKVESSSKTTKTSLIDMASCYGNSKSQWKAACKAAAQLESISKMTQSEIESVKMTATKAASAARDAAIECSKKAGAVSASYAEAQAANEEVISILAQIEQIRGKISDVSGRLKNLSDFVNKAAGEVDKVKDKPGDAAGYAKDAEAARDKVANILKGREKEEKATAIIQATKTASQTAVKAAKDANSSFSSASKTIKNAKKSLKSLQGQAAKLAKVKTGCDVGSGDIYVGEAQATKDTADVFAEGADENANTAENCSKFVSIALANRRADKEEDEGNPFENDPIAEMREKILANKETEREIKKQTRILSESTNLSSKDKFTQKGMEKERKEIEDKILRPYTDPPQCTNDEQCEKLFDEKGWTCNPKTNKCIPPQKKEPKPECTENFQCEELHGKGWTCDTKAGICVSPKTKETKFEPEPEQEPQKEPVKPDKSADKPQYYIIKKTASGIWHWKNYRCTETIYEVLSCRESDFQEKFKKIENNWNNKNQKCKEDGCNRGAIYSRIWRPQTWSVSKHQSSLEKRPQEIPKNGRKCTGSMTH